MFSVKIGQEYKYDFSDPKFKVAFDFLKRTDLADLAEGRYDLGHGSYANVQHYSTSKAEELNFEAHQKYFDVQYLIEGVEYIGVCQNQGLKVKTPYVTDNDVEFYSDPKFSGSVLLTAGDFVVLAPEDVHKPRVAVEEPMAVKKVVVKVPVEK